MAKKTFVLIFSLTLIGAILHFYNLNWGAPFYFHPDERNIASAVAQLHFPQHMNPQFFAYGSLPIYTIYFTGVITNYFLHVYTHDTSALDPTFSQAIMISRTYSALFATLLIPLFFLLGKKLKNARAGILAAFFATASTGFIQFAHFGTFEMWLTFFSMLLFWSCLTMIQRKKQEHIVLLAVIFGILLATKISSLVLFPLPLFALAIHTFHNTQKPLQEGRFKLSAYLHFRHSNLHTILILLKNLCLFICITSAVYILTNPYVILDTKDFQSSMHYESSVALGTEPVFYTGNFLDTTPVLYQFLHVYPFLLNPLMTVLFIASFLYLCYATFKQKNRETLLLIACFLILFLSQAILFVKWTRYIVPTLPFIMLTIALALAALMQTTKPLARLVKLEITILVILNSLVALSYFKTAFIDIDSRILAVLYAQNVIPLNAQIFAEPSDLGALPFQEAFPHFDNSFNIYDLDNGILSNQNILQEKIDKAEYIILPSQRLLQSRIQNPKQFPKGYFFYQSLLNGTLGFHQIYQTPCDIFCRIVYLGDPVYWWEQTASVFDHPSVFIFKKTN